jgi:hypothetical protein
MPVSTADCSVLALVLNLRDDLLRGFKALAGEQAQLKK